MKTLVVLATVLGMAAGRVTPAAAKGKGKEAAGPADPNAAVAKAHAGKVWVRGDAFPGSEGNHLSAWLGQHPPRTDIAAKVKDGPWTINYLAVFKRPSVPGAMTVQFFEKGDAKSLVDQYSPENAGASLVFQGTFDLSPDQGFNKGHSYVIKVGQLLKGKFVPYASGELALK